MIIVLSLMAPFSLAGKLSCHVIDDQEQVIGKLVIDTASGFTTLNTKNGSDLELVVNEKVF